LPWCDNIATLYCFSKIIESLALNPTLYNQVWAREDWSVGVMIYNRRKHFERQEGRTNTIFSGVSLESISYDVFNTPIIQYSITPCEGRNSDRQSHRI